MVNSEITNVVSINTYLTKNVIYTHIKGQYIISSVTTNIINEIIALLRKIIQADVRGLFMTKSSSIVVDSVNIHLFKKVDLSSHKHAVHDKLAEYRNNRW